MRMTDKASGELGKVIAHPLQAKVDKVVFDKLGDKGSWIVGDYIKLSEFSGINNKSYLDKRLNELNLWLDVEKSRYTFGRRSDLTPAKIPSCRLVELKTDKHLAQEFIKQELLDGAIISNKHLDETLRNRFLAAMGRIKKMGLQVINLRLKDGSNRYSVYCIEQEVMDDFASKNMGSIAGMTAIKYRLTRFGEVKGSDIKITSRSMARFILDLRNQGWVIEAAVRPNTETYYKLISKP